uniref:GOST seven transmembrane domain-containing protein n=1 Tax=Clytia hemisphaerica TaxID=252671 RepID=A0A7M5XHB2_9CNID
HDHALSTLGKKIRRDIEHAIRRQRAEDNTEPYPALSTLWQQQEFECRNELRADMNGLFVVGLMFKSTDEVTIKARIDSVHKGSYLSAMIYKLLSFYGVMSLIYLAYAISWFIDTCCKYWKDLLRVQFWIGGVIALGMFENALFYSAYQSISHYGKGKYNGRFHNQRTEKDQGDARTSKE